LLPSLSESTKQPEVWFRALLTDGTHEVQFEQVKGSQHQYQLLASVIVADSAKHS
jgi:hypothetical protein